MSRDQHGFALLASALIMLSLAGITGLSIDIGHLYAVRAEAQSLADSLAMTGARELDGTRAGMERAKRQMAAVPRTGYLRISPPTRLLTDYSRDGKTWESVPSRPDALRSVRVRVALDAVELFFLPAVVPNKTAAVSAVAVAEQETPGTSAASGMVPYAVYARSLEKPDYGYQDGDPVTLRWSAEGAGCGGPVPAGAAPRDGYIQGVARNRIREAIEDGLAATPVEPGKTVRMVHADSYQQASSLMARVKQDTNAAAGSYAEYRKSPGNGRRAAQVAVVDENRTVLGFFQVFLPAKQPPDEQQPLCAEFAGLAGGSVKHNARLVR